MADESVDLRQYQTRRLLLGNPDVVRASSLGQVFDPFGNHARGQTNTSSRNASVKRQPDNKDVVPYSVWARVRDAVRQARWNSAIGRSNPDLDKALSKFLGGTVAPRGDDYFAAASFLDRNPDVLPQFRTDDTKSKQSVQSGRRQTITQGTGFGNAGDTSPGATSKTPSRVLLKLLERRDAIANAIRTGRNAQGKALSQSEINGLLQFFNMTNTLIASYSMFEGLTTVPSEDVDAVATQSPAGQEVRRLLQKVGGMVSQAIMFANRKRTGILSMADEKNFSAIRMHLRHLQERGVTIRGNIIPLATLHPELARLIERLTAPLSSAEPSGRQVA